MTTKTKNPVIGDLLIHEESAIFCREEIAITNPTAAAFTAKVGQPLDGGTLVVDAGEAGCDGILLEEVTLTASQTTTKKYAYLARGPAVLNKSSIIVLDSNGATMDIAALVSALAALDIRVRLEPTVSSTQTN